MQKKLVPAGFEEFNFHRVAGKGLTMEELTEMTEAMPMMAERTLIVVTDCDLYKLGEEQRTRLIAMLDDFQKALCRAFGQGAGGPVRAAGQERPDQLDRPPLPRNGT